MFDNSEIQRILLKLENLADEELAVKLLQEFNRTSSELGKLLMNRDPSLGHAEWKDRCDDAKERLDALVKRIDEL
jgi:hypothetical protein